MIREATKQDIGGLAELMGELGYPTNIDEMNYRMSNILSNNAYQTYVYEEDEKLLGMIGMILCYRFEKSESYIRVVAFVVNSGLRGNGIGTKLLNEAENWAKKQGAKMVTLNSGNRTERNDAHNYYIRRGFEGKATGFYKQLN
ncbi:GCN5-related N-acetyltransferase (plasmid) [Alkalihalophilus pseudofirmus OF4]|uniref:GCN5-related N-acetyltransferase n=1 Tax=Alkalihalophilus pseudofirmus (strain ATCC BAA-2126 / JCM 17055 / OF4) TaxID=398511 RepID=D3G1H4_ALKPO|nr:GNAT family N-acetyltransferase [Alkalihalophilus pseudofirmus]ADC52200.1 GCN5-related N-acetyltransferase [Alkalihalophilus pseudofirmus OF4]